MKGIDMETKLKFKKARGALLKITDETGYSEYHTVKELKEILGYKSVQSIYNAVCKKIKVRGCTIEKV